MARTKKTKFKISVPVESWVDYTISAETRYEAATIAIAKAREAGHQTLGYAHVEDEADEDTGRETA